ncbi:unnamed protein product, partial [Owenia fusiformis]
FKMSAHMDLDILHTNIHKTLESKVKLASELGYEVIAINNFVPEIKSVKKQKKGGEGQIIKIQSAETFRLSDEKLKTLKCPGRPLKQLTRFTTIIKDHPHIHQIGGNDIQSYDIVAAQPSNEKFWQAVCKSDVIDIISLDFTERLPFHIKRQQINEAIGKGIHFEINYSPALSSIDPQRYTISGAQELVKICKGKNIILSSRAVNAMDLRGPYDVANFSLLFGLNEEQAKAAVSTNCRAVLKHAESRKSIRGVLTFQSVPRTIEITPKELQERLAATAAEKTPNDNNINRSAINNNSKDNISRGLEKTDSQAPNGKLVNTSIDSSKSTKKRHCNEEDDQPHAKLLKTNENGS